MIKLQTSQAAEHSGRLAAVQLLTAPSVLYGDCKPVVEAAKLPCKQLWQTAALLLPGTGLALPASHEVHAWELFAPSMD